MSLSKLQEAVGLDKGSLPRVENGEIKRPDFNIIQSIAAVLDIPGDDIVEQYIEIGHKSHGRRFKTAFRKIRYEKEKRI